MEPEHRPRLYRPSSLEALSEVLREQPDAELIGGGTLALPRRHRIRAPGTAVLLNRVPELAHRGRTLLGASIVMADLVSDPAMPGAVRQAAGSIGGPAVRLMATVGGNIAAARPGCLAAVLLALDAELATLDASAAVTWGPLDGFVGGCSRPIVAARWHRDRQAAFAKVVVGSVGMAVVTVAVGAGAGTAPVVIIGRGGDRPRRLPAAERTLGKPRSSVLTSLRAEGLSPARAAIAATLVDRCLTELRNGGSR
jgi:CO/xanthine dehydrogenase FAD-binding subunit